MPAPFEIIVPAILGGTFALALIGVIIYTCIKEPRYVFFSWCGACVGYPDDWEETVHNRAQAEAQHTYDLERQFHAKRNAKKLERYS